MAKKEVKQVAPVNSRKLSSKQYFTSKSMTVPGQSFSAGELIKRSTNGTMPPIFMEAVPYDFDDVVNGKQVTYDYQEQFDCDPLPAFPQIEDIFTLRDQAAQALNKANYLIKKQAEREQQAESAMPSTPTENQITA